jgi:hypothetical protein
MTYVTRFEIYMSQLIVFIISHLSRVRSALKFIAIITVHKERTR